MKKTVLTLVCANMLLYSAHHDAVSNKVIEKQRAILEKNTKGKGFGPQSPLNIDNIKGDNKIIFEKAPHYSKMNLCNIHFHKNAEHKGGEFSKYFGNGDGKGYNGGYVYSGKLSKAELEPLNKDICPSDHGKLFPGDTLEIHYVYSSAQIKPGESLQACISPSIKNPQLRVEAQVVVLVNDKNAQDFNTLTEVGKRNGKYQALNLPNDTGTPIEYMGSTTGPAFNKIGSPFQVSWAVRPKIKKVNISSVGKWCEGNIFKEDHAHGVRNLIKNKNLLPSR